MADVWLLWIHLKASSTPSSHLCSDSERRFIPWSSPIRDETLGGGVLTSPHHGWGPGRDGYTLPQASRVIFYAVYFWIAVSAQNLFFYIKSIRFYTIWVSWFLFISWNAVNLCPFEILIVTDWLHWTDGIAIITLLMVDVSSYMLCLISERSLALVRVSVFCGWRSLFITSYTVCGSTLRLGL